MSGEMGGLISCFASYCFKNNNLDGARVVVGAEFARMRPGHEPGPANFGRNEMRNVLRRLWCEDQGQDIAEYAVMLAVILVIVVGTIRLIGTNANNVFSSVASSIQ
jgi:Flp pilus assembly pilin Flp